jgi:hypothetical protein
MRRVLLAVSLLICSGLHAQGLKNYIVAERRGGTIEIIDPVTLNSVSQLRLEIPSQSAGLNGVALSSDGTALYVEGPATDSPGPGLPPGNCCYLFSIDLATLHAKKAAGIWGTFSREAFIISNGMVYPVSAPRAGDGMRPRGWHRSYLNPDGHSTIVVRNFQGLALDEYDLGSGNLVRRLVPEGLDGQWFATGAQSDDKFYFYATKTDGSAARLWTVSADTARLGPGLPVGTFGQTPGCPGPQIEGIVAANGSLFVYEIFGSKIDRRDRCAARVDGGIWQVDLGTGKLLRHDAPDLHFTKLIPDQTEPVLYGLAAEGWSTPQAPVQLVRIDARDGRVVQSRLLDVDYWWMAAGPLRETPSGNVKMTP